MKKTSLLTLLLLFAVHAFAQKLQVNLEFSKKDNTDSLKIYVGAMKADNGGGGMLLMTQFGKTFSVETATSETGLYNIVAVTGGRQLQLPLYIADASKPAKLKAKFDEDGRIGIYGDANNEALSAFNAQITSLDKEIWTSKPSEDDVRKIYADLAGLTKKAKGKKKLAPVVEQYINMWAYVSAYNNLMQLPRILGKKYSEVTLRPTDVLPAPKNVLDNEQSLLFRVAPYIMMNEMPHRGSLMEIIESVRATYSTPSVVKSLENLAANSFVNQWNAEADFEAGLQQIEEATKKYALSQEYVHAYMKRKPIPMGASFPAEVVLKDTLGGVVPFDSFKGKYVYIDVWASWCGPCCREVPYLQKLEAELENKDVVFVSISVDSTEAPWRKKMKELGMHGNQLFDASKKFCEIMNITGIPRFLIYDKEGRLLKSDAPRPSSPETKALLEGLK